MKRQDLGSARRTPPGVGERAPGLLPIVPSGKDNTIQENGAPSEPVKKNSVRTRGAVTGHNVRYVLAFGLAGVSGRNQRGTPRVVTTSTS